MYNLKQSTSDLDTANGKVFDIRKSIQNILAVIIKGTKKQRGGDENGTL